MDVDDRLHRIPAAYRDPREIEKRMHRDYDTTQRKPNIFLLNGRAFPFTLRDTPIVVKPNETTKLRVLNAGGHTLSSPHRTAIIRRSPTSTAMRCPPARA